MAQKPVDSTKLISFDFGPLVRSLDNLRTGMTSLEKKVIALEAGRHVDNKEFEKYQKSQRAVQDILSTNINDVDERLQLMKADVKKQEHSIFTLNIEKDISADFQKTQASQNSDLKMEFVKLFNRISEEAQIAKNGLALKAKDLEKIIKQNGVDLKKQIDPLQLIPEQVKKMAENLEKQDLYVFEIAEKTEKLENETKEMKSDIESGLVGGGAGLMPMQTLSMPVQQNQAMAVGGASVVASPQVVQMDINGIQLAQPAQPQAPPLDLKYFVKKTIQQKNPESKTDLQRAVIEMIKEAKRQQAEDEAEFNNRNNAGKGNPDGEEVRNSIETEKTSPLDQFQWDHLPSQIEAVMEEHVRQGGDTLVYLEQMRPRFRQFEVAQEMHQIFNHVEVQTYQQDQILKQANKADVTFLEINLKIDEMLKTIKKNTIRLDSLDNGRTQDLAAIEALPEKQDQHRSMLSIFADMKSDVLMRTASKDQQKDIEARLSNIERANLQSESEKQSLLKAEIDKANESIVTYNKAMQALQMQIMKTDTNVFDLQRLVQGFDEKLSTLENVEKTKSEIKLGGVNFDEKSLGFITKLMVDLNLVKTDQFEKLKKEVDDIQTQGHSHENKLEYVNNKIQDHTKLIRTVDKKAQQAEKQADEMQKFSEKMIKDLKGKIDTTDFDDEVKHLTSMISSLDTQGKANQMRGQHMRQLPKKAPAAAQGTGLSKEDKKKMEDTYESVDKLEQNLRVLSTQIRNINLDDIKQKLQEIPEKVSKSSLDKQNVQTQLELGKINNLIKNNEGSSGQKFDRISDRVTRVFEANSERGDEMKIMAEQLNRIEDSIQAIKRSNQADKMKKKLTVKAAELTPAQVPNTANEIKMKADEIQAAAEDDNDVLEAKIKLKLSEVMGRIDDHGERIRRLQIQAGQGGKDTKKSPDIRKLQDQMLQTQSNTVSEVNRIASQIDDLQRRFEEKIRRQSLVAQKKLSPTNSDEDIMKGMKNRPKFMAQHMTRELVLNGRLPQLENYGDHLARYGKGFSQMLNIAGDQRAHENQTFSPRMMEGFNISEMAIQQDEMSRQRNNNADLEQESQERVMSLERSPQKHQASALNLRGGTMSTIDNPFATNAQNMVSPSHSRKVSQRRNTTNRSHLDTSHKKGKEGDQKLVFSPLARSDSIQLVLPNIS